MKCLLFVGLGAVLDFIDAAILTRFIVNHHVKLAAGIELEFERFHRTGRGFADFQQNNVLQHPALYIVQNLSCDICLICFGNRCKIGVLHQGINQSLCDGIAHTGLGKDDMLRLLTAFVSFRTVDDQIQHKQILLHFFDMLLRDRDGCFTLFLDLNDGL